MATPVIMPKQGNSVESCIIVDWKKQVGDPVAVDDVLCEIETDKATLEVPSPAAGTLLAVFFQAGDDVPVLTTIAVVGKPGEDVGEWRGARGDVEAPQLRNRAAERCTGCRRPVRQPPLAPRPSPLFRRGRAPGRAQRCGRHGSGRQRPRRPRDRA